MAIRFCTTTTQFQAALDACVAGDIIRLDHTKTFFGEFRAKDRGVIPDTNRIIIEGDGDTALLPAPGYRIFPVHDIHCPKLYGNSVAALRFMPGANGYYVRFLEFIPNLLHDREQMSIGTNDADQVEYFQQPYNITIDRVIMRGDRLAGQKRAIGLHGKNLRVENCYFDHHKGVGQDTSPFGINNGEGPFYILNNYIHSGAYGIMSGGDDVKIRTNATVLASPAPTTSDATFSSIKDLSVGQLLAYRYFDAGIFKRAHVYVTGINTLTNRVSWGQTDAPGSIPDTRSLAADGVTAVPGPGDAWWGIQYKTFVCRRNHFDRPQAERTVLPTAPLVNLPVVTPAGAGLVAGTYYWTVQGIAIGKGYTGYPDIRSPLSLEQTAVLTAGFSTVALAWSSIPDVTEYRVYRYQKNTSGAIINGNHFQVLGGALTFTDTGAVGTAFTSLSGASSWTVKNHFELKHGIDVQCDSNIFENSWKGADNGYMFWVKSNNQSGRQPFAQTRNVMIEKNILRHAEGYITTSGKRSGFGITVPGVDQPVDQPEETRNVVFRNNLCYDSHVSKNFDTNPGAYQLTYDHNTAIHTSHSCVMFQPPNNKGNNKDCTFTNNLWIRNSYGVFGASTEGKATLDVGCAGVYDFNKNVISGASASLYNFPGKTNYFPTLTTFQDQFKNYNGANPIDWKLKRIAEGDSSDSIYLNLGTDGKDLGCDIDLVIAATAGVLEGLPEGTPPPDPDPPPPDPASAVVAKQVSFIAAQVVGAQVIEVGFAPKAILFYHNLLDTIRAGDDYEFGFGAAFLDGTMFAGFTLSEHASNPSDTAYGMWRDRCIGTLLPAATVAAAASVTGWGATNFTLTWTAVDTRAPVVMHALVLGGNVEGSAFDFPMRSTNGTQDIATLGNPTLICLYTPILIGSAPPMLGNRSASVNIGFASSETINEQWAINNRFTDGQVSAAANRMHDENAVYVTSAPLAPVSAGAVRASLLTMLPTGFRLNFTLTNGFSDYVLGFALRGATCRVHRVTEPPVIVDETLDVTYDVGFRPEAVICASAILPSPGTAVNEARLVFGTQGPVSESRATIFAGIRHAVTPTVAATSLSSNLYEGLDNLNPPTPLAKANVTAYHPSGYTLTWDGTPSGTELLMVAIGNATVASTTPARSAGYVTLPG